MPPKYASMYHIAYIMWDRNHYWTHTVLLCVGQHHQHRRTEDHDQQVPSLVSQRRLSYCRIYRVIFLVQPYQERVPGSGLGLWEYQSTDRSILVFLDVWVSFWILARCCHLSLSDEVSSSYSWLIQRRSVLRPETYLLVQCLINFNVSPLDCHSM